MIVKIVIDYSSLAFHNVCSLKLLGHFLNFLFPLCQDFSALPLFFSFIIFPSLFESPVKYENILDCITVSGFVT